MMQLIRTFNRFPGSRKTKIGITEGYVEVIPLDLIDRYDVSVCYVSRYTKGKDEK